MTVAADDSDRRDALWGELLAFVELERPESHETLAALNKGVRRADPRDVVRAAANGLAHQAKLGDLDLEEADFAATLLERVRDPLVVSSFLSMYSNALGLAARYEEARRVADAFAMTAREYRLDFAIPYANAARSLAAAGLRQWSDANLNGAEAVRVAAQDGMPMRFNSARRPGCAFMAPKVVYRTLLNGRSRPCARR